MYNMDENFKMKPFQSNEILVFGADKIDHNLSNYLNIPSSMQKHRTDTILYTPSLWNIDSSTYIEPHGSNQFNTVQVMNYCEALLENNENFFLENPNHFIVYQFAPLERRSEFAFKLDQFKEWFHMEYNPNSNDDIPYKVYCTIGDIPQSTVNMFEFIASKIIYGGFQFMTLVSEITQLECYFQVNHIQHMFYDPYAYFTKEFIDQESKNWPHLREDIEFYFELAPRLISTGNLKDSYVTSKDVVSLL